MWKISRLTGLFKPSYFPLGDLFARREAKTRIRQRDWLKLVSEKIRREQVGTVPTFFSVRANKFAKWKIVGAFSNTISLKVSNIF